MAVVYEDAVATAVLADVFGTIALEELPSCLDQDAYVAAETNLSLTILRQHLMTLATLDTVLANGFSDVVEPLAQIVHAWQGPLPRMPRRNREHNLEPDNPDKGVIHDRHARRGSARARDRCPGAGAVVPHLCIDHLSLGRCAHSRSTPRCAAAEGGTVNL